MVKICSYNPATEELIWEGNSSTEKEIKQAISKAQSTHKNWSKESLETKITFVNEYKERLKENKKRLATLISQEVGKPLWESLTEVDAMIGKIDISVKAYKERCPTKESSLKGMVSITSHKPHGLVVVLGPYNFPGHLPNGHIIPALLAGNCILFKPSEKTPLVGEAIVKLWDEVSLPEGVITLLQGGKECAIPLTMHPAINGIFFTGSWETGHKLTKQCIDSPHKILALEMGGNNPLIVSGINDFPAAAYTTVLSSFLTSGQRCTCSRRLIIPNGKEADKLIDQLVTMSQKISIGPYNQNPEPFMGPLISKEAAETILFEQQRLISLGGKVLLESKQDSQRSSFITPGIIDVSNVNEKCDKEFFGPLLKVIRVQDFPSAIEEANATKYGLSAGLLSDDSQKFEEFYHKIQSGIINWNTPTTGASSSAPFGGIGKSGNFHPSAYYAADYCSYPVASMTSNHLSLPTTLLPGLDTR